MFARARRDEAAARATGDLRLALRALRESRALAELAAKLTGAFRARPAGRGGEVRGDDTVYLRPSSTSRMKGTTGSS